MPRLSDYSDLAPDVDRIAAGYTHGISPGLWSSFNVDRRDRERARIARALRAFRDAPSDAMIAAVERAGPDPRAILAAIAEETDRQTREAGRAGLSAFLERMPGPHKRTVPAGGQTGERE